MKDARHRRVTTHRELADLLDRMLEDRSAAWWDRFYENRYHPCPFFREWPDENLVAWFGEGLVTPGRVLELGCGNGRNAVFMAQQGCDVRAVDFSREALSQARTRADEAGVRVDFVCTSLFDLLLPESGYDFVYDCGCFHHIPPHRRPEYLQLVTAAVRPGGRFGLVCFAPEGGSGLSDKAVYVQRRMGGGLGFSKEELHDIFGDIFHICEQRRMRRKKPEDRLFGEKTFQTVLMQAGRRGLPIPGPPSRPVRP
ncbi:methyltransferase family protein [Opitutaceae bacterium TAV1]|nr:methyltransferase family protein [Opitutaceae bacterium TAV1]